MSLPEWRDNIGYEEGDVRVFSKLTTGYPRCVLFGLLLAPAVLTLIS